MDYSKVLGKPVHTCTSEELDLRHERAMWWVEQHHGKMVALALGAKLLEKDGNPDAAHTLYLLHDDHSMSMGIWESEIARVEEEKQHRKQVAERTWDEPNPFDDEQPEMELEPMSEEEADRLVAKWDARLAAEAKMML